MLRVTKTENGIVRGFPGTDARITVFKGVLLQVNMYWQTAVIGIVLIAVCGLDSLTQKITR